MREKYLEVIVLAIERGLTSAAQMRLNAGTQPGTGSMITKTVSLGRIKRNADADKLLAVAAALLACCEYPFSRLERREVTTIEA